MSTIILIICGPMKIIQIPQVRSVDIKKPEGDARSMADISCSLIDDLLVHPLQSTGRLSDNDLSAVSQLKAVICMLGEEAGVLEDMILGKAHEDGSN
jgi:hypothetical protein